MVCEFLPLFEFAPRPADQPEELDDPKDPLFAVHNGLNTVEETDTPLYTEGVHELPRSTLVKF
ncbi:hypothetical protein Hanom_Chr14g01277071 [Helianthus anomalus]